MDLNSIIEKLLEDMNLLESKKSELIRQAAEDMEKDGFETTKICSKLIEVLEGKASPTYIRDILPDKYKQASKIRNTPPKQKTEVKELVGGGQETKQDIPIVNVTRDNFMPPSSSEDELMDKTIDEMPLLDDKEKKELLERIETLEARITELETQVKEKDKEIFELKSKLAMQQPIVKKQIEMPDRSKMIANNPLISSKTHEEYDKTKYLLSKPKT